MDFTALHAWLETANERYRREEIPFRGRPFHALRDSAVEHRCSLDFSSPTAKEIFRWFTEHSAPGAHAIGAMFTGAFYFDTFFWPLHIPIVYGQVQINALDCVDTMPQSIKEQLRARPSELWRLALYWADCVDYAYGLDDIQKLQSLSGRALEFMLSGDRELSGAIAQLTIPRPNPKAILGLRMATEIFLKAVLIQESNATEADLKRLGHRIPDITKQCRVVTGNELYDAVIADAKIFPDIHERYDATEWPMVQVWHAAVVTQAVGAALARRYSDRDLRSYLLAKNPGVPQA